MPVRKKITDVEKKTPVRSRRRSAPSEKKNDFVDGDLFEGVLHAETQGATELPKAVDEPVSEVVSKPEPELEPVSESVDEMPEEPDEPGTDVETFLKNREKDRVKISKNFRKRYRYSSLLRDWYGENGGDEAMLGHLPQSMTIGACLDKTLKRIIPPWLQTMTKIQENWEKIVGVDNIRKVIPAYIERKVLYVELRHPMFRSAFDVPVVKTTMVSQINACVGENVCTDIKFCARGEFQRSK